MAQSAYDKAVSLLAIREHTKKELKEEIGAEVLKSEFLGKVASDSGLTSGIVEIY